MGYRALALTVMGLWAAAGAGCVEGPGGGEAWGEQAAFVEIIEAATYLNVRSGDGAAGPGQIMDIAFLCGERGLPELGLDALAAFPDEELAQAGRTNLLFGLEQGGHDDAALDLALDMAPSHHRAMFLRARSSRLALDGACYAAGEVLLQLDPDAEREPFFGHVAECLARTGRYEESIAMAGNVSSELEDNGALEEVLYVMFDQGLGRRDLPPMDEDVIDGALFYAAQSEASRGRCGRALELTRQIRDEPPGLRALVHAGACFVAAGEEERGDALLDEAEAGEPRRLEGCDRARAVERIGLVLTDHGLNERASRRAHRAVALGANECEDTCNGASILLASLGELDDAVRVASSCRGPARSGWSPRATALQNVALRAAAAGRVEETRMALEAFEPDVDPRRAILSAAEGLVDAGVFDEAAGLLDVFVAGGGFDAVLTRRTYLGEIQQQLLASGALDEVTALVEAEDPSTRDFLLAGQASFFSDRDNPADARAAAEAITDFRARVGALQHVVLAYVHERELDAAQSLLESLPPEHRGRSATELARAYADEGDPLAALSVALLLEAPAQRSAVLTSVAEALDPDVQLGAEELDLLLQVTGEEDAPSLGEGLGPR